MSEAAPRIAVVAIHGVGDHQPFEMAKSVANMLEALNDGVLQPRYTAFSESRLLINVAPVKVQEHAFASAYPRKGPRSVVAEKKSWGPLGALLNARRAVKHSPSGDVQSLDHLFMEGQLARYRGEGPEDTYETVRLEGKRLPNKPVGTEQSAEQQDGNGSGVPEKEIHVYDMFWSDLSGVSKAGLRIFGELYQLLFHLGSIGVNNVKAAALSIPHIEAWNRFNKAQVAAAGLLAWPIPILNLIVLLFTVGLLADSALVKMSPVEEFIITAVLFLAGVTAFWGYRVKRANSPSFASYCGPVVLFMAACAAATGFAVWQREGIGEHRETVESVATCLAIGLAFIGLVAIMDAYEQMRPGTNKVFRWLTAAVAFSIVHAWMFWPGFLPPGGHYQAMSICLRAVEVTFWLLLLSWVLFWIATLSAFVIGKLAVAQTAKSAPEFAKKAEQTNWTARLTIALPAVLFLLLTFAAWAGLVKVAQSLVPHLSMADGSICLSGNVRDGKSDVLCYSPLFPHAPAPLSFADWTSNELEQAGIGYMAILLLLVAGAAVISLYALIPSVIGEVSPPRGPNPGLERDSESLGRWLDFGYRFMRWAGRLLYIGVLLFPLGIALPLLHLFWPTNAFLNGYLSAARPFGETLGTIVAGAALGVLGFGGRLSKLALGLRPVVRVALDVDNWLREHPRESNPTARICGRYVSLLRHIAQWKAEDGIGYDALIVFAHSQGTVITADLLRFITAEAIAKDCKYDHYDSTLKGLDEIPVELFTVGCPLRQLYALRFPFLYGYAPSAAGEGDLPDPESLGVEEWINSYRTGDYVGRYLWRPHPWRPVSAVSGSKWDPPEGLPENIWVNGRRIEFTIGPGAHTHYWDSTAEPIAETLDVMIARASKGRKHALVRN